MDRTMNMGLLTYTQQGKEIRITESNWQTIQSGGFKKYMNIIYCYPTQIQRLSSNISFAITAAYSIQTMMTNQFHY